MVTGIEWKKGNRRAKEILTKHHFKNIQIYPKKGGCPFDIYAEKDDRIYLIDIKYTDKEVQYNYVGMPYALPSRLSKLIKGTDRVPMMLYINDEYNEYSFLRFDFEISDIHRPIKRPVDKIEEWIKKQKNKVMSP